MRKAVTETHSQRVNRVQESCERKSRKSTAAKGVNDTMGRLAQSTNMGSLRFPETELMTRELT